MRRRWRGTRGQVLREVHVVETRKSRAGVEYSKPVRQVALMDNRGPTTAKKLKALLEQGLP